MLRSQLLVLTGLMVTSGWAQFSPNCNGKQVIVHLFEWKWTDIALECERYLSVNGFCGVQVSPPMEHILMPDNNPPQPWWIRYQPVSYKLTSRGGSEAQFIDMVQRCNAVGVRIYVDAVINHMTGLGRSGTGDAGSTYNASSRNELDFPGVPYNTIDFTPRSLCPSASGNVDSTADPNEVRNCYLLGLTDLYGASTYVRNTIAAYLNRLIAIGVAGIRIDAAKHMWPADIGAILGRLTDLPTSAGFPQGSKLYVYQEVTEGGAVTVDEYYNTGHVTEFKYCRKVADAIRNYALFDTLIDTGMARSDRAFVFVDNHDNQRGHGSNDSTLMYKDGRDYIQAQAYTLAQEYGVTQIMSSYAFDNRDIGPPTSNGYTAADVVINADGSCSGGWVCEHRWNVHLKMVAFRNAVAGTLMRNYWNNGQAIAFSRDDVGFFAMAKNGFLNANLQTGLPAGSYCNLIDDCATGIDVGFDGRANVKINNYDEPIMAVCIGCDGKNTRPPTPPTTKGPTLPPLVDGIRRTVVFLKKPTNIGQDIFLRGGIDGTLRPPCDGIDATCALPIRVNSLGTTDHYARYNTWRVGDLHLDWFGAEAGQGIYFGTYAEGTPMVVTSNAAGNPGYQDLNTFGDNYWMVDFDLDCSKTVGGWFEVKAYLNGAGGGWENTINQAECTGSAGGLAPYSSGNHLGRCGYITVFDYGTGSCIANAFPTA